MAGDTKFCIDCGQEMRRADRFCSACGRPAAPVGRRWGLRWPRKRTIVALLAICVGVLFFGFILTLVPLAIGALEALYLIVRLFS